MTIGERIKALRKANNMTQEKLAESLCVSCQAVSKWECGISIPDISLIAPLTKIFHVTADDLLGINECAVNEKKKKYDNAYQKFRHSKDYGGSYWCAKEATVEFPNDYIYLEWLANTEYRLAFSENKKADACSEYFDELMESSLRHYETVIENCPDPTVVCKAVLGKIIDLRFLERIDEAEWSAEFEYPDINIKTVKQALSLCSDGTELLKYLKTENKS